MLRPVFAPFVCPVSQLCVGYTVGICHCSCPCPNERLCGNSECTAKHSTLFVYAFLGHLYVLQGGCRGCCQSSLGLFTLSHRFHCPNRHLTSCIQLSTPQNIRSLLRAFNRAVTRCEEVAAREDFLAAYALLKVTAHALHSFPSSYCINALYCVVLLDAI